MLYATVDLARRIERAEIDFCATAAGEATVASFEAAGARALYSVAGSPLNKVLGLGVGTTVTDADLQAIETFYRRQRAHVRIELCPLGGPELGARLSARGYVLQELETLMARALPPADLPRLRHAVDHVTVSPTTPEEDRAWVIAVAHGFAAESDQEPTAEAIRQVSQIIGLFVQPGIDRLIARSDGAVAGGGATFVRHGVLGIFGTSTMPRFRRRGVQTAVILRALAGAPSSADVATATTQPGSTSQRTFERLGFARLYTRSIMVLPLHTPTHGSARRARS